jgi:tryptophan-rich sensory protein
MMGIAFFIVWNSDAEKKIKNTAIIIYVFQLAANFLWSFIFFYAQQPGWALVDIVIMWVLILLTIVQFGKISSAAAWLLVPYICWVSFATILNFAIWKLN